MQTSHLALFIAKYLIAGTKDSLINQMKQIWLIIIIIFLAGCTPRLQSASSGTDSHGCSTAGGLAWCESQQKCLRVWQDNCSPKVGNDRDSHGCIGSAGYTWCEPKNKCLRIWEENCTENTNCTCPDGYRKDSNICTPLCYSDNPPCEVASLRCL